MLDKIKNFAEGMDALRIWPRLFITMYIWLVYESSMWFMALADPNGAQSGFIGVVIGAGAAWFTAYVMSGRKNNE